MYGGRARRIELAKKAAFVLFCLIVIFVSIKYATRKEVHYDMNSRYNLLSSYFQNRGYVCTDLVASGGKCIKNNTNGVSEFSRHDNGFIFIERNDSVTLTINYQKDYTRNGIELMTTNNALLGYKKKDYVCSTKDGSIIGELDKCIDKENVVLDSDIYLGIVENSIKLVKDALYYSGYDVDILLKEYKWVRVR
jgi:hypothetical protein